MKPGRLDYPFLIVVLLLAGTGYLLSKLKERRPDIEALGVEYKSSIAKVESQFKTHFSIVERHKTWPKEETEYGD